MQFLINFFCAFCKIAYCYTIAYCIVLLIVPEKSYLIESNPGIPGFLDLLEESWNGLQLRRQMFKLASVMLEDYLHEDLLSVSCFFPVKNINVILRIPTLHSQTNKSCIIFPFLFLIHPPPSKDSWGRTCDDAKEEMVWSSVHHPFPIWEKRGWPLGRKTYKSKIGLHLVLKPSFSRIYWIMFRYLVAEK